jgi:hypothetical protein
LSFNLRIPAQNPEDLFAMSIVSAATTLSTVSVVFLASTGSYGLHLLFCPVAFGLGLALTFWVYTRVSRQGYIDDSAVAGLIPALGYRMTHSKAVAVALALVSAIPMLALLTLEIRYGVSFLEYLLRPLIGSHDWNLQAFLVFIVLLMGYVFLGGFRAVIASDVLQYRAMTISLFFCLGKRRSVGVFKSAQLELVRSSQAAEGRNICILPRDVDFELACSAHPCIEFGSDFKRSIWLIRTCHGR